MAAPRTLGGIWRTGVGVAALAVAVTGCSIVEGNRAVCPVDVGELSLRVLEDTETITVVDAASEGGVDDGLVFDRTSATVVLVRTDESVSVLALGRAEEAGGAWSSLAPDGDCRLENGPALRVGAYSGGTAALDLDGTIVSLPAPTSLTTNSLTAVTERR